MAGSWQSDFGTQGLNEHGRHFDYAANCLPLSEKSEGPLSSSRTSMPCEPPGNHSCGAPTCKTCPILVTLDKFSSRTTGKFFKVKIQASCKSSNVIYLITCRWCGHQYVGEKGQPFHLRVNGHWFDIEHRKTDKSPVSSHFNGSLHTLADISVMVIQRSHSQDLCLCRVRESRWISTLGTSFPLGMNLWDDSLWNLPPFNTSGTSCAPSPWWLPRSHKENAN